MQFCSPAGIYSWLPYVEQTRFLPSSARITGFNLGRTVDVSSDQIRLFHDDLPSFLAGQEFGEVMCRPAHI